MPTKIRLTALIGSALAVLSIVSACTPASQQATAPAAPAAQATPAAKSATPGPTTSETAQPAAEAGCPSCEHAVAAVAKVTAPANTFVFGRGGDSVKLDPAVTIDGESGRVTRQIYDNLVKFEGQTTNVVPSLAESWNISPDGKVWTFKLRSGVKFHDGTPFDADAVVFNFERWMDAKNPYHTGGVYNYWANMFGGFKNDEKTEKNCILDSVKALDANTVQFTLKSPMAPFLNDLAMYAFAIASPTAIKKDPENFFKNPVGTGAFKFVEWVPGDHITLEANRDYWGEKPKLDRLIFRVIKDGTARLMELKAGTIQGMDDLNPDDLKTAQSDPNIKTLSRPSMNIGYITFNMKNQYVGKKEVRQAINYAINRKAIVEALFAGIGEEASQTVPPMVWGHNPDVKPYPYDPEKAKALLKQAGLENGFTMDLWYMPVSRPYAPAPKPLAEAIAADLAKVGIKVNLKTEDWGQYVQDWRSGKFDSWMLGWSSDNGDPDNFLFPFWGQQGEFNTWDNEQVRTMLQKAQVSTDRAEREKLYKEIAVIMADEQPRVHIVHTAPVLAFRSNVEGYVTNPAAQEFFNTVYFK